MAVSEPKVVVAHREHLWWLLAEAIQLEHMIMCQYLFAEFSLKDGAGDGLTPEQADAVDRWRRTLHGIAVEEMLHIALVANLTSAIGAAPGFGRPKFPQRSGYFPSAVQLDLLRKIAPSIVAEIDEDDRTELVAAINQEIVRHAATPGARG